MLVMFYIFLLQTIDLAYKTTSEQSIALDLNDFMCDYCIGSSLDPINMIDNSLKTVNEDILHLLFIVLQTYEIKSKVDILVKRSHALQVSCKILNHIIIRILNLKYGLYLLVITPDSILFMAETFIYTLQCGG